MFAYFLQTLKLFIKLIGYFWKFKKKTIIYFFLVVFVVLFFIKNHVFLYSLFINKNIFKALAKEKEEPYFKDFTFYDELNSRDDYNFFYAINLNKNSLVKYKWVIILKNFNIKNKDYYIRLNELLKKNLEIRKLKGYLYNKMYYNMVKRKVNLNEDITYQSKEFYSFLDGNTIFKKNLKFNFFKNFPFKKRSKGYNFRNFSILKFRCFTYEFPANAYINGEKMNKQFLKDFAIYLRIIKIMETIDWETFYKTRLPKQENLNVYKMAFLLKFFKENDTKKKFKGGYFYSFIRNYITVWFGKSRKERNEERLLNFIFNDNPMIWETEIEKKIFEEKIKRCHFTLKAMALMDLIFRKDYVRFNELNQEKDKILFYFLRKQYAMSKVKKRYNLNNYLKILFRLKKAKRNIKDVYYIKFKIYNSKIILNRFYLNLIKYLKLKKRRGI